MSKYAKLALANISEVIQHYQKTHAPLNNNESEFLMAVDNRARAIITTYQGWLKNSDIADAMKIGKKISQKKIVDSQLIIQKKIIGFLCATIGPLLNDIRDEKESRLQQHLAYLRVLAEIERNLISVLENIKQSVLIRNTSPISAHSIMVNKITLNSGISINIETAKLLNGRVLPFSQSLDPLKSRELLTGRYNGSCYGHVKSWCDQISEFGHCEKLHCHDSDVMAYQENQKGTLMYTDWLCDIYAKTNFRDALTNMLNTMQDDKLYILHLYPHAGCGHVMGIRKITSGKDFEYFDPNFGTFAFNLQDNLIAHLANLICNEYYNLFVNNNSVGGELRLHQSGNQPLTAKACLPSFATVYPQNTRFAKKSLDALVSTLFDVALQTGESLTDISYLDRHSSELLLGATAGTLLASITAIISNVVSAHLSADKELSILASIIAASIAIENNSRFFSSAHYYIKKCFFGDQKIIPTDRRLARLGFERKHEWVSLFEKSSDVEHNLFLFSSRNADHDNQQSNSKREAKEKIYDDRPLKKHAP